MDRRKHHRLVPTLLIISVIGVSGAVAGTALATSTGSTDAAGRGTLARPASDNPARRGAMAPVGGVVPGLTGAAAVQAAGDAAARFRELAEQRSARMAGEQAADAAQPDADAAQPDAAGDVGTLATLHTAWGTFFSAGQGLQATHSVLGFTTRGGDYVYAPTAFPPGACSEMTTAYTPSGPLLWAWDWCGGRDSIGKTVSMNASFLATYTTTVNGRPAYSMQEVQTSASANTWTVYLYNYVTHAWDVFYSSSGARDISGAWDFFEIYTTVDPATGAGYYCQDAAGKAFEASSIQVQQNGAWTPATSANSRLSSPPAGSTFDCPSLTFSIVHANDGWLAQIGGGPTTPPTTTRPPTTTTRPPTTTTGVPTTTSTRPPTTSTRPPTTQPPNTTTSAPVSGACSASYSQVNSWPGGFQGTVTVTAGSSAINGWTVRLTFPNGVSITQAWNGVLGGAAPNYTVKNQTYNGALASGGSTTFGFLGSGTAATPTLACTSP